MRWYRERIACSRNQRYQEDCITEQDYVDAFGGRTLEDILDNCDTYSELLDQIDTVSRAKPKIPKELYEGEHGGKAKCFLMLQTLYPMITSAILVYVIV